MTKKIFKPTPLSTETRAGIPTLEAAFHLSRAQQTLRVWAVRNDGPVKCLRIHGRLHWSVAEIKALLGVAP